LANFVGQGILGNQGIQRHPRTHTQAEHHHIYRHISIGRIDIELQQQEAA